ncbi:hypothetical protein AB8Q18_08640 [Neisseriaceae bacterium CLB008]
MKTYTHEELNHMANNNYAFITPDQTNAVYVGLTSGGAFKFIDGFRSYYASKSLSVFGGHITPEPPENG